MAGTKNNILTIAVIILVIANAATLVALWLGNKKQEHISHLLPAEYLIREVSFTPQQQKAYLQMVSDHRKASMEFRDKLKRAKEELFGTLQLSGNTDSIKAKALHDIAEATTQLDKLTLAHFTEVRKLCDPAQQKKFDIAIKNVLRMMSGPPPPMRSGDPPMPVPGEFPPGEPQPANN